MALNGYQITELAALGLKYGFESESEFLSTVGSRYSEAFVKNDYNVGQSIDIVLKPRPNPWIEGRVINPQSTDYDRATVTVIQRNTSRVISEAEHELSAKAFMEDVIKPDNRGGVREAEIQALNSVFTGPAMADIDSVGKNPANSRTWNRMRAKYISMLGPKKGVYGMMRPMAMADLADNESKIFGPTTLRDNAALEGNVRRMAGVGEFYESNDLPRQINGDGNTTGASVDGPNQTGNQLTIKGAGNNTTYLTGQQFYFSANGEGAALDPEKKFALGFKQVFTLTQDCNADSSGDVELVFSPPIITTGSLQNQAAAPSHGTAVRFLGNKEKAYPQSLLYHGDAIEFVGLKLPALSGQGGVTSIKMFKNLPIRSAYFTDYKDGLQYLRKDMMTGCAVTYWQHVWRQWGQEEAI